MIRTIKKIKPLNLVVRKLLKAFYLFSMQIQRKVINRWDIAGIVNINYKNIDFNIFSNCDDHNVRELYYGIEWEKNELNVWSILAKNANVIFDVGANTGIYSIISAKLNDDAKIFAFEPNPVNVRRFNKNVSLNKISNLTLIKSAVGDQLTNLDFTVPKDDSISLVSSAVGDFSKSFFNIEYKTITVEQITIDEFVKTQNIKMLDLIKIDVEYFELNVLKGASKTLKFLSPVILCEIFIYEVLAGDKPDAVLIDHVSKTQASDIQIFMNDLGYSFYYVGDRGLLKVDNLLSNPDGGRNYLFSKYKSENIYIPYNDEVQVLNVLQ